MGKSTAIVTWITHRNFGTYLQAYALQQAVKSLGYSNKVIDDGPVLESLRNKRFSSGRLLKSFLPGRLLFKLRSRHAEKMFRSFKDKFIDTDDGWKSQEELSDKYEAYIAGSDQIWSPAVPFDSFYYLGFTRRPKVAYGPSLGTTEYPDENVSVVKSYLEEFTALSVREPIGASVLKEKFSLYAEVVADPTMLITAEDWKKFAVENSSQIIQTPYAICYMLTYNSTYVELVRAYCRDRGLRLKTLVTSPDCMGISDDGVYTGPEGFLNVILGAEVIFTDSFHGTIFSILFEKQFYTFRRFRNSNVASQNQRLEHLLSTLGLADRFIGEDSLKLPLEDVDYGRVCVLVKGMRKKSLDYLSRSLNLAFHD